MPGDTFIHPSSEVSPLAKIGQGTKIWQHCTVLAGAEIGEGCMLSANVFVEGRARLGKHVKVKNNVSIYDLVELEDDVFIGPSAVFTNVLTPRSHWSRKDDFLRTLVRQGATIGANATVVCGSVIGRYAMVGAGSVVTGDVPDFALVYGVPARQHGWVCYCGERLVDTDGVHEVTCSHCGSRYALTPAGLVDLELKPQAQHPEK
jgi:UDP-2-acetamido-3-amino-2,3-dideoxy-glucuronate N-acetyltransferase